MRKTSLLVIVFVLLLAACGPGPAAEPTIRPLGEGLLAVDAVSVEVSMIGPAPHISVTVSATLPDDCTLWEKGEGAIVQRQEGDTFYLDIAVTQMITAECAPNPQPLELGIGLDYTELPAGTYTVNVNGVTAQFEITPEQAFDQNTAEQIEAVVAAVGSDLAARGVTEFDILSVEPMLWGDGCLNLAGPDEMCTEAIVPGYLVVVGAGSDMWEYHTNQDGSQLRVLEP